MAISNIAQLKAWFKRGMRPTAAQFADWMDSYWHREEKIDIASIDQLPEQLNGKYPDSDGKQLERKTAELEENLTTHEQYSEEKFGTIYDRLEELDETKIDKAAIGQADGVAGLDSQGRVPASQLPSYVDDVLEGTLRDATTFVDPEGTPYGPESGKIYIDTTTNKEYRWSGSQYAVISESLALGETASTAYRGDRGKAAYDHAQIKDGSNPHRTTFASLPDKPAALPADGGNADTVGGLTTASFAKTTAAGSGTDLDNINGGGGFVCNPINVNARPELHYPIDDAGLLIYGKAAYESACQIYGSYRANRWFCRGGGEGPTKKTAWAEFWTTKNLGQDDIFTRRGAATDLNAATTYGIYTYNKDTANAPTDYGSVFVLEGTGRTGNWMQLAIGYSTGYIFPVIYIRYRTSLDNWGNWARVWNSSNFDPNNYLPLSGGKVLTGDVSIRNGKSLKSESDTGVVVGLTDTMGDGVHRTTLGSTRRPAVIVTDGTPVKRQDGSGAYKIWDSSNFDPADYMTIDRSQSGVGSSKIWVGTQAQYDAIATKSAETLYFIQE